jgi:hypothetical protein
MDFLTAAHELFRQAEDQAKDDQCLLAKVRRARLSSHLSPRVSSHPGVRPDPSGPYGVRPTNPTRGAHAWPTT